MPELPEAETIARQLHSQLAGRKLGKLEHVRTDMVRPAGESMENFLKGKTVRRVHRRGKRVVLELDGDARLVIRLGMTGRLGVQHSADPIEKHTHLRMRIVGGQRELRFRDPRRFGGIWLVRGDDAEGLGAEPLEISAGEFRGILRRRRQIKALLMDQSVLAGLGNIYCDESLYRAGIHPLTLADRLTARQCELLRKAIRAILRSAIRHKGSTLMDYRDADGNAGGFQSRHSVYGREGKQCRKCGTVVKRIVAAGRSTFFCPRCQRPPRTRK